MRPADQQEWLPAVVPGSVYGDLMANSRMPDPFYRDQEDIAYSLMEQDYVYRNIFTLTEDALSARELRLVLEGVDTLADISVNDQFLLSTENMHRPYSVDISSCVHEGTNTLTILFHSPLQAVYAMAERGIPGSSDAVDGFPALRKAHCMFGWDWGPRLPDAGLYRPVYLWAVSQPKLSSVLIRQAHAEDTVTLHLTPEMDIPSGVTAHGLSVHYTLRDPEGKTVCESSEGHLSVKNPGLWWPNGYGSQPLYTLRADLYSEDGVQIDTWERRIGLRTFSIRRTRDDMGESFAFTVNGTDIFAMGADYIPEDNLLGRITPERTRRLLEDAVGANFNCIRVWGGGYYPDDFFFDICDELGLLVWQDFMFACAAYELTPAFEANIRSEFSAVIRRLRHHPSLALWCGNNEVESAVADGWWKNTLTPALRADYIKIFEYILPQMTGVLDPDRPYWPSSPSSGGCLDEPSCESRGDSHYWDVWHGDKPFSDYRKHFFRFVSEFGFQSFPDLKTIQSFTEPGDRNIFSYVMERHQRNRSANGKILNYISATYRYPASFPMLIYASQLLQMEAIRCGVEHWRRHRGVCMGTLFWQLNDCWPVASWSSIDYYGRWKALHYDARRFFAPVLLSCEETGLHTMRTNANDQKPLSSVPREARLNISNETRFPVEAEVAWELRDPLARVIQKGTWSGTVAALSASFLDTLSFPDADFFENYLSYTLIMDGRPVSMSTSLFCAPKHFRFADPALTLTQQGDCITVHACAYARMVCIVCEDGDALLSDNYFDMNAGERTVRIVRGSGHVFSVYSVYDIDRA